MGLAGVNSVDSITGWSNDACETMGAEANDVRKPDCLTSLVTVYETIASPLAGIRSIVNDRMGSLWSTVNGIVLWIWEASAAMLLGTSSTTTTLRSSVRAILETWMDIVLSKRFFPPSVSFVTDNSRLNCTFSLALAAFSMAAEEAPTNESNRLTSGIPGVWENDLAVATISRTMAGAWACGGKPPLPPGVPPPGGLGEDAGGPEPVILTSKLTVKFPLVLACVSWHFT